MQVCVASTPASELSVNYWYMIRYIYAFHNGCFLPN